MLLDKLIDFNSVWKFDSKELKTNLYKLFFDWKEQQKKDDKSKQGEKHASHEKKDGKNDENQSQNEDDEYDAEKDKDEKKKRQQLRLEQELQVFLDNGGFTKVLKDIFNPTD